MSSAELFVGDNSAEVLEQGNGSGNDALGVDCVPEIIVDTTDMMTAAVTTNDFDNSHPQHYTFESKLLAIAPKIPAILSILGSSNIIYNIIKQKHYNKQGSSVKMYHQLLLGLSIVDIISSHIYFLGTMIIPKGSDGPFGLVFWAFGTTSTCSYGGFFNQFAVASPIYNTMLSLYFILKLRYNWSTVSLNRIGPIFHAIPISFALGTSFFALLRQPATLYGNVFWTCWINPSPPQPDFRWFQWSFLFAPIWICVLLQSVMMLMLFSTVKGYERDKPSNITVVSLELATPADEIVEPNDDQLSSARINSSGAKSSMASINDGAIPTIHEIEEEDDNEEEQSTNNQDDEGLEDDTESPRAATSKNEVAKVDAVVTDEGEPDSVDDDNSSSEHANPANISAPSMSVVKKQLTKGPEYPTSPKRRRQRRRNHFRNRDRLIPLQEQQQQYSHAYTIAIQGILYVAAFYITWFFPTLQRILELANVPPYFALQALDTTLLPLQGLFNVIIYLRPKYVFYRKKYPDLPRRSIMQMLHNRAKANTIVAKHTTKRTNNNNTRAHAPAVKLQLNHATVTNQGDDTQLTNEAAAPIIPVHPTMASAIGATVTAGNDYATRSNFQGGFSTKPVNNITHDRGGGDRIANHGDGHTSRSTFWTGFKLNDTVKSGSTKQLNS